MNNCALRTERAVADYLDGSSWTASGLGKPTILVSYGHGANMDEGLEDTMPAFPRIVITATSSTPVMPTDLTHQIEVQVDLQISADDTYEGDILSTVGTLQNLILPLFDDSGASALTVGATNASGPYTAFFAVPGSGESSVDGRGRTFTNTLTIFGAATI